MNTPEILRPPEEEEIRAIMAYLHLDPPDDLSGYASALEGGIEAFRRVESVYKRSELATVDRPFSVPPAEENPCNAWHVVTGITNGSEGPLSGWRIALKDNIALAGVIMANGSHILDGYVPDIDAAVVTRLLAAGATIAGKAVCEDFCISGTSETSAQGPVENPHGPGFSSGGSSSGCAALVAMGAVDAAVGTDQGGSIRIPSAWCGVVGLKPSHGIVPYSGILSIERTLDHAGPIAKDVKKVAMMLEVLAGRPFRLPYPHAEGLSVAPHDGSKRRSIRLGIVEEGFGWPGLSEEATDQTVMVATERLEAAGMELKKLSVPLHRTGVDIMSVISIEGASSNMIEGCGNGSNHLETFPPSLNRAVGRGMIQRGRDLYPSVKALGILGHYMRRQFHGAYYAMARKAALLLADAYDAALADCDVLVLPTVPFQPWKLPDRNLPIPEAVDRTYRTLMNTAPFDATGHPALTLNSGFAGGFPVGMMIVGRRNGDGRLLAVAAAIERALAPSTNPSSSRPLLS